MGIFSKFRNNDSASLEHERTREDHVQGDPEKVADTALENGLDNSDIAPIPPHQFAAVEKRVLKKLDRRLVSLVFVLCKSSCRCRNFAAKTNIHRSPRLPRPL